MMVPEIYVFDAPVAQIVDTNSTDAGEAGYKPGDRPTCGAATDEACELHAGGPRTESHRDRKLDAVDAVERGGSKR